MSAASFNNRSDPVDHVRIMSREELLLLLGVLPLDHYLRPIAERLLKRTGPTSNREAA